MNEDSHLKHIYHKILSPKWEQEKQEMFQD